MNRNDVFISYRRKDVEFTKQIDQALRETGRELWVDWEDIPPGVEGFADEIQRGIEGADALIAILSPNYLESEYCLMELREALRLKKRVVPIVLEKFDPAPPPEGIGHINWVYFTPHAGQENTFEKAFPKVIEALEADYEHARNHTRWLLRALDWEKNDYENSFLLKGAEIDKAEQWQVAGVEKNPFPTQLHSEYILKSRSHQRKQQRQLTVAIGGLLIIAVIAAIFAFVERNRAEENEADAIAQATLANAQRFQRGNQRQLSTLLAIASWENDQLIDAADVLRQNLTKLPIAVQTLIQSNAPARDVAFSPNGRLIAAAMENGELFIWDTETGDEVATLTHPDVFLVSLAFSPDNKQVATSSDGVYSAFIWDIETEEQLLEIPLDELSLDIAFHPDGHLLVTGTWDGEVSLWNTETGTEVHTFDAEGRVGMLAFSSDGRFLLIGGGNGYIMALDNYEIIATLPHKSYVLSVAFSPDGTLVATASTDSVAAIWDAATGEQLRTFHHQGRAEDITFSPDGQWVAIASEDSRLRLWHIDSGEETQMHHDGAVTLVTFSPDSRWLASVSDDQTARLWDIATGGEIGIMALEGEGTGIAFHPDGRLIATTTWNGNAHLWDISPTTLDHQIIPQEQAVTQARFHPQGNGFVTLSQDFNARLWENPTVAGENTSNPSQLFSGHDTFINGVDFHPDGTIMATASDDGTVIIWDTDSGEAIKTLEHPESPIITSVAIHPDGEQLVAGDAFGEANIWDISTGEILLGGLAHTGTSLFSVAPDVTTVAYHPDGQTFATGTSDGLVRIWDNETGKRESTMEHDGGEITAVIYHPDGHTLVTASSDGSVHFWDVTDLNNLKSFNTPILTALHPPVHVLDIAYDLHGEWIATASSDSLIRFWDTETGNEQARLAYSSAVTSVDISPDGTTLLSTNGTTTRVWTIADLPLLHQDDLTAEACTRVTRELTELEWEQFIAGDEGLFSSYQTFCSK